MARQPPVGGRALPATATKRASRPWRRLAVGVALGYAAFLLVYAIAEWLFGQPVVSGRVSGLSSALALMATFEPFLLLPLLLCLGLALLARSRLALVALAVAALPFVLYYLPLFLPRLPAPASSRTVTVMTHNILAANRESDRLAETILSQDADIVALQELVGNHAARLAPKLAATYPYRVIYADQGLGLYSRYPLRDAQLLTLGAEGSYAIRAVVDLPGGPVTVFNAHPRHPRIDWTPGAGSLLYVANFDPSRRDRAVASLVSAIDRVKGPVIVLGDLNLPDRSGAYRQLTEYLKDAHREAGWGLGYTFPEGLVGGRFWTPFPFLRIDYVLHSPEIRALEARPGPPSGSDHLPVVARLDLPG